MAESCRIVATTPVQEVDRDQPGPTTRGPSCDEPGPSAPPRPGHRRPRRSGPRPPRGARLPVPNAPRTTRRESAHRGARARTRRTGWLAMSWQEYSLGLVKALALPGVVLILGVLFYRPLRAISRRVQDDL